MQPFLALITPIGGDPPQIWGGGNQPFPTPPINIPGQPPGYPAHPIYNPPGIWGPTDPRPGYGLPGPQPGGGVPTHPIYYPPGIWGPTDPRPGYGLPGQPPGIWGGGNQPFPTPPIVIPPPPPPYPDAPEVEKPFPPEGGWGYDDELGWVFKPPAGAPTPKF